MADRQSIDGYLLAEAYPSFFHREFSPAWIDAMLLHKGHSPPRRDRSPFNLLELGCGDGFGLILLAAAYPEGEFLGIDALPEHVEAAITAASAIDLKNVEFRCARFAEMGPPPEAHFDYVTAQGVLAWVSADNRDHVFRIAAQHLRPGGVACLGYNTLPGWKDMLALQRLLLAFADLEQGSGWERFAAALETIRSIAAAGAATLPEPFIKWFDEQVESLPRSYFPHEYLNQYWMPLWSADIIAMAKGHGLAFLGPSRSDRLREDFCMTRKQREKLAAIEKPIARELAADLFVSSSYRTDLYGLEMLPADNIQEARLDGWWAATVDEDGAELSCRTQAGTLRFDNLSARAILRGLAAGPRTLGAIHRDGGCGTEADILNAADALLVAGHILPAAPPAEVPRAAALNAEIGARTGRRAGVNALVGSHGPMTVARDLVLHAWSDDPQQRADAARSLARLGVDAVSVAAERPAATRPAKVSRTGGRAAS